MVGGPYSMMQVYAWAGMLVTYSQNDGLVQAAKDTFSGEKPCGLCHKIAAARDAERESPQPLAPSSPSFSGKLLQEMIPAAQICLVFPSACELPAAVFTVAAEPRGLFAACPPTPPPRSLV
jgi:hypothetical protein